MNSKIKGWTEKRIILPWDELPEFMKDEAVKPYWEVLWKRRIQLRAKRLFDVIMSVVVIIILFMPMLVIAVAVKIDSQGPVLYRQVRVTQYGRKFKIIKFRTMHDSTSATEADFQRTKPSVTVANDTRITKVGRLLRRYRLDEFPQLFNVLRGDMSFVGTRPEVPEYVKMYKSEWNATLLMPSGITSECSIRFRNEDKMLGGGSDVDKTYLETVLPQKMKINLKSLLRFSVMKDLQTLFYTLSTVVVVRNGYR